MKELAEQSQKHKEYQWKPVEQGEEIIITRHGKEVTRLVPVRPSHSREQARAAIRRIRERAEQHKLSDRETRDSILRAPQT